VAPPRLFALDQNFPEPIVKALRMSIDCADLVPVREIDEEFPKLDDWDLLARLRKHDRPWDGLITCDNSMLSDARIMAMLERTGMTLVIADGQGHHPIRATGLILSILITSALNRSSIGRRSGTSAAPRNQQKSPRFT
jgi:hypothetical protein